MATALKSTGFPRSPSNGDEYSVNGKKWRYNVNIPGWEALQITDVKSIKKDTTNNQVLFGNENSLGSTSFTIGDNIELNAITKTISVVDGISSGLDADLVQGINGSYLNNNLRSGVLYGGVLSVNVSDPSKFDISAGSGVIISQTGGGASGISDPVTGSLVVSWSSQSSISLSNISSADTTWIYVNSNGVIGQQTGVFSSENYKEYIVIGAVVHPNRSTISFTSNLSNVVFGSLHQYDEFIRSLGPAKISGHRISANGSNMKLNRSSGYSYLIGSNYVLDSGHPNIKFDSGYSDPSIHRYYSDGSSGFNINISSSVDGSKYDNGSGTLQNVSSYEWSIQRMFYYPGQTGILIIYYGNSVYASLSDAISSLVEENFNESTNTKSNAIFCGWIIVKGSATQLNNSSDAKIIQASIFREVVSGVGSGGSSISFISELSDVETSSPSVGQLLVWDGSNWTNQTLTGKISYVSSPSAPNVALYNAGDRWYNTSTGIEYTLINDGDDLYWVNIYISPNEDYIMSELTTFMKYVSSPTAPSVSLYKTGDKWLNTSTGTEFTLIDDGSGTQWVNLNTNFISHIHPISEITGLQGELDSKIEFSYDPYSPVSPNLGDRWIDSDTGEEYVYVYDGISYHWIQPSSSTFYGAITFNTTIVNSSTYYSTSTDYYIGVNYSGLVTIILPQNPSNGRIIIVKDESGEAGFSSRMITIQPYDVLDTIDNDSSAIININNGGIQFIYRNGWRIV